MNTIKLPLAFFVDKLNSREPFSFVRYGDGELMCAGGYRGENCDHTQYTPDLAAALRRTLEQPRDYFYAIGPKITMRKTRVAVEALRYLETRTQVKQWYDSETILNASVAGQLRPFIEALRARRVMLVGAAHLRALPLAVTEFVEVPLIGAWNEYDKIYRVVIEYAYQADVILFCAGMCSKILLYDLFPHLGRTTTLLDIGSTFDLYCGKLSRSYARRMDAAEIARLKELNFRSEEGINANT